MVSSRAITAFSILVLSIVGFTGFVYSQTVITTTTTRLITIEPTTYTTETTIGATTIVATYEIPGYTLIMEIRSPDQTCTIVFRALEPPGAITIPGVTIAQPGTTISTVFNVQSLVTTVLDVEGGTTSTTTGLQFMPIVTEGLTLTMPVYGVSLQFCDRITITNIITYIVDTVPATIVIAFEGISTTFAGTTIEMELPEIDLTTTMTRTNRGTTERITTSFPGTSYTTTQTIEPTTIRETIVREGTTRTEVVTIMLTMTQTTTPTAATTTPRQTITPPGTTQMMAGPSAGMWLGIAILVVLLVVAVSLAALVLRTRR